MRKTILIVLALTVAATGLLTSCNKRGNPTPVKVLGLVKVEDYKPVAGKYGGRLVMATISEPKSFNPVVGNETSTGDYTDRMFLGLTRQNAWTYEVEPEMAVSWTSDESGLVWTIKLRPGVEWSDGQPFTADDVVFTYALMYNKDVQAPMRDLITGPKGEEWKVEKVDDLTVKFTLFDRNAIFPELIGAMVLPKHKYEPIVAAGRFNDAMGSDSKPEDLVGTGPFMLGSYDGTKVTLKRNPRYYRVDAQGQRMPYLDELVFLVVPSADVQILKFRQGEIDVTGIRGSDYPIFSVPQQGTAGDYTIFKLGPAAGSEFLFFNMNNGTNAQTGQPYVEPYKLNWFRDKRFRQAVSHAIDRDFIVRSIMNGMGYPQYGPMNEASGYYFCNPNAPKFEYDLNKARALLKEMGLEDRNGDGIVEDAQGHQAAFNLTTNNGNDVRDKIAETLRKDLEKLGMKVNFRSMSFNILISKLNASFDWESCVMGLTGSAEPAWGANVWKSSGMTHQWFPKQKTPSTPWEARIDELFDQGVHELNKEKRREVYFEWQKIVGEEQPLIYTAAPERLIALRDKFGNIFPSRSPMYAVTHNVDEIFAK